MHLYTILLTWFLVRGAHTGTDSNDLGGDFCECSPQCSSINDNDCKSRRFMAREDCPCCKVCLRQQGESCSVQAPCDKEYKLTCSASDICQVATKCGVDSDCPDDLFCVKQTCTDPCILLQPCLGILNDGICVTRNHQPRCECRKGSSFIVGKCIPNDQNTAFELSGKQGKLANKVSSKPGSIEIISTTQNSTIVLVPSIAGGILHYKERRSDIEASKMTVAEGEQEATIKGLNPSTKYILKWVGNDGSSAKSETKTNDGCRHQGISYPVGAKWHEGCQTTCNCHIGGVSECRPRCIFVAGAIQGDRCIEQRSSSDPECCVEYDCQKGDNSVLENSSLTSGGSLLAEPKLIVTSRTHNSVTVAWDDFRADDPSSSYVTEYREVPVVSIIKIPWMKRETPRGQPPPTMTIANLKPNTLYEVRVGIYSNINERRLNAATETITVRTEPGCVYGNTSFPVGEFFQGCDERCSCASDGSVKCSERCSIPYFRKNSFANDHLCTEKPADRDDCCVRVKCHHEVSVSGIERDYDQCANTVCGKNAECVSWPALTDTSAGVQGDIQPGSCRCLDGFSGDPANLETGCISDPEVKNEANSCKFKSMFHSPGDVFFDGCSYTCTCNKQLEIECRPRCKYSSSDLQDDSCTYKTDPKDSCCQIRNCNSTVDSDNDPMTSPSLNFDGCSYGNKTYAKDERFSFECDSQCLCMGFGDVSCSPRCPPTKEIIKTEGLLCETLLDPEDECCTVTVCDTIAPEVMKAGVSENMLSDFETTSIERENSTITMDGKTLIDDTETSTTHFVSDSESMTETITTEAIIEQTTSSPQEMIPNVTVAPQKRPRFEDLPPIEITNVVPIDSSTVKFVVHVNDDILQNLLSSPSQYLTVSYSPDAIHWDNKTVFVDDIEVQDMNFFIFTVPDLETDGTYQFRVAYRNMSSSVKKASLPIAAIMTEGRAVSRKTCQFKGQRYEPGETFYEGCENFCQCTDELSVHCGVIECPKDFGLSLLDPGCLEWEDDPTHVPTPPKCCGLMPKCSLHIDHLSCSHEGSNFKHLDFIDNDLVGCDQRCQCISGQLDCEDLCPPVLAIPPFHLRCSPRDAKLVTLVTFPCCREWQCATQPGSGFHPLPPGIFSNEHNEHILFPSPPAPPPGIPMPKILDVTENSVTFAFTIPNTFVGLPGGIYLRYSDDVLSNPLHLKSEIIHEDGIILDQAGWQYTKKGLQPATDYSMVLSLSSPLMRGEILSPHFVVTTLPDETQLQQMEIHPLLMAKDITSSSAVVSWRLFTTEELRHIHGVKVRYWAKDEQIPKKSSLLHVEVDTLTLRELMPNTHYIVDLVIIPQPSSSMQISVDENLTFTTLAEELSTEVPALERFDLDAELSVSDIRNTSAKISWKHFTDIELRYIDGVRVRFWSGKKRFPQEGPMLHREADNMILRDLEPDNRYTVDLFFMPHMGLTTAISNTRNTTFVTLPKPKDMYAFNISIAAGEITQKGVEILYSGVTQPEGKYVNVYRVIYTSDGDIQDSQKFKVPKNQKGGFIILNNLRPRVQYEVWLEAFLTNGDKMKSNVIGVATDYDGSDSAAINEIESKELKQDENGNYYSAFVAVAILVAIACLLIIGLLFVLMRRTSHAKAQISSKGNAAYDNPSYKSSDNPNCAIEMNGMKNAANESSEEP